MSKLIRARTAVCSVVVGEAALAAPLKGVCGCATCADAERRVRDNAALGLAAVVRPAVARHRTAVGAAIRLLGFADRAEVVVITLRTDLYGLVVAVSHFLIGCDAAGHAIITCGVATIKGKHQLQGGNHGNHLMRKKGVGCILFGVNVFGTVRGKEGGKENGWSSVCAFQKKIKKKSANFFFNTSMRWAASLLLNTFLFM